MGNQKNNDQRLTTNDQRPKVSGQWSVVCGLIFLVLGSVVVEARIGGGEILIKDKKVSVTFSHEKHVKDFGLTCTDCHSKLFITSAKRKSVAATLKNCLTCHGKKW